MSPAAPVPWRQILLRLFLVGSAAFVLIPAAQCLLLNFVNPPLTLTMVSRIAAHGWDDGEWTLPDHTPVPIGSLPSYVPLAAVSSEDRLFFSHHGFDFASIRHAWHRYRTEPNAKLVGGSTISQQVARNVFLWQHRSWLRKGLEAWYTIWMELLVPKRRILEVYLGVAEMGPMTFGIEAAAQHWYGKPARQLRPSEAAHIIALLPSPQRWNPKTPHVQKRAAWIEHNPVRAPL